MQNNLDLLDNCIAELVRKFLFEEKNDKKAQLRDILEEHIESFLSVAADDDKFYLQETPFILLQSTSTLKQFTALGASIGWNAIFQYATNLMAQPWRREFYKIRMFSGYYQHNVEYNLVYAWRLLTKIGYERIDDTLELSPPLDPDAVVIVARDALVAYVECQMIQSIWEGLHKRGAAYNWIQLLEYRKLNICSVSSAIASLSAEYKQHRLHQSMHCHDHFDPRLIAMSQQSIYGPRYVDCYGIPRYGTYVSAPMVHVPIPYCNMNPNMYAVAPQPVNVPTAQLIEVEPPQMAIGPPIASTHSQASVIGPPYSQHPSMQPVGSPMAPTARPIHSPSSSTPRMENGFVNSKSSLYATVDKSRNWDSGTQSLRSQPTSAIPPPAEPQSDSSGMENWDYVYSGLENQGYNKDVGERGDLLRSSGGDGDRGISDRVQRMHIDDRESSDVDGRASLYDNVPSPAKLQSPVQNEPSDQSYWRCCYCTFHNKLERSVCEMCNRSRNPGPEEQPLASGGRECPECTLVNKKDAVKCDACDTELKGSPTYV